MKKEDNDSSTEQYDDGFSFDINPMSGSVRCKKCGSYDVYIRAGMFVDHYYCKKCGNEQIG
jgi:formylmethanofuran dehydrogenase subunit E